ncbi:VanZ family protein [Alkaliphilus hydrothermalis]|uniref:Glycopeptide antibiotics resistance protein n=1 Tax=Alkaliphilus hydrothermalis TaxID=1482730 RepID=A0ABS2NS12_9FIRM|nr:VanZ family protein [Alkaliphilus hydrothermalis]MBM7615749.1 glycopeptide antibiotics resistance protein [Alkaliphilus hydrothermalis]
MRPFIKRIALVILLAYTLLLGYWMLWGFGRAVQPQYMYNIVPFRTIKLFFHSRKSILKMSIINLIGNIGVFVPFGILIPLSFGGKIAKMLGIFLRGLLLLEILQLLTRRGSFDVDDLILNTVGAMVGYGLYKIGKSWFQRR